MTNRTVLVRLKADASDFNRAMAEAAGSSKALSDSLNDTGDGLDGANDSTSNLADSTSDLSDAQADAAGSSSDLAASTSGLVDSYHEASDAQHDVEHSTTGMTDSFWKAHDAQGELSGSTDRTSGRMSRLRAEIDKVKSSASNVGDSFGDWTKSLDSTNDRTSMLVQYALALGPALVPIGAVAVPAIAGLAAQLTFASVAAGVTLLAFKGVGGALKAVNDYQVKPTAANLEKMNQALSEIGPAGRDFVMYLQELRPQLQGLQDIAQAGLLPGAEEGIRSLMTLMPQAESVIATVADTVGNLMAQGGASLAGPGWTEFFTYLDQNARPILTELGQTLGNFIEGIGHMIVAFDPLTKDFSSWFLDMSRDFNAWADGLSENQGFADFVNYIEKSGPQVGATFGALVSALAALVEAAAPVGGVVLQVVEQLANVLAKIASSPAGPMLIGAAAGLSAISRAISLYKVVNGSALVGFLGKAGKEGEKAGGGMRAAGAGLAVLALSMTDVDEKMGISNTAMFASMGMIAGPWGAAIGAGVGAVMDFAAANNDLEDAVTASGAAVALSSKNFEAAQHAMDTTSAATRDYNKSLSDGRDISNNLLNLNPVHFITHMGDAATSLTDLWTHSSDEAEKAAKDQQAAFTATATVVAGFAKDAGLGTIDPTNLVALGAAADQLRPKFQAAGVDMDELASQIGSGGAAGALATVQYGSLMATFAGTAASLRSTAGQSQAVGSAFEQLGNTALTAADGADALKTAMDTLFGTELNQSEATDKWTVGVRALGTEIGKTNGKILGNSKAALSNREAIRGSVTDLEARVQADAAAGVSGGKLIDTMLDGRDAILKAGVAAGASKREMNAYLNTLGLTPKNLVTIIEADGALSSTQKVQALGRVYKLTPRQISTAIRLKGNGESRAGMVALLKTYGLTPPQITTFLRAIDQNASANARKAKAAGDRFAKAYKALLQAGDDASPKAVAARAKALAFAKAYLAALKANNATGPGIAAAQAAINRLQGKTVTLTTVYKTERHSQTGGGGARPMKDDTADANGGLHVGRIRVMAEGGFTEDGAYVPRVPQIRQGGNILWSEPETGWEAYISGKPGMENRNMEIWRQAGKRLGANFVEYANGNLSYAKSAGSFTTTVVTQQSMTGPLEVVGTLTMADGGEARIRGIARSEVDGAAGQDATMARQRKVSR